VEVGGRRGRKEVLGGKRKEGGGRGRREEGGRN
jgi:hypothetical protein